MPGGGHHARMGKPLKTHGLRGTGASFNSLSGSAASVRVGQAAATSTAASSGKRFANLVGVGDMMVG